MRYSFEMALVYLKQGKKIRRDWWEDGSYIFRDGALLFQTSDNGNSVEECSVFLNSDILAEDWEVCDEPFVVEE